MTKNLTTHVKPPRVSVPIEGPTLEVYQRLARAFNRSLGSVLSEWLGDTSQAAEAMAEKVESLRGLPRLASMEIHRYAQGMADETGAVLERMREHGRAEAGRAELAMREAASAMEKPLTPPSSNTGGKVSKNVQSAGKRRSPVPLKFPLPPAMVQAHADTNGVPPKAKK